MRTIFMSLAITLLTLNQVSAREIFRIEIGKDYGSYSDKELRERIWRLENAVFQLQQKVFQLQNSPYSSTNTWVCTLKALNDNFSATGATKAVAKMRVIEKCSKSRGDSFFCKDPKCEQ
jgi:hypothetical protein